MVPRTDRSRYILAALVWERQVLQSGVADRLWEMDGKVLTYCDHLFLLLLGAALAKEGSHGDWLKVG